MVKDSLIRVSNYFWKFAAHHALQGQRNLSSGRAWAGSVCPFGDQACWFRGENEILSGHL
jgi:hypothetical protein